MKKITVLLLLLLIAASAFSQDMFVDESEKERATCLANNNPSVVGATTVGSLQQNNYSRRINALKVDFMYPLFGCMEFTFEQSARLGKSWEISLGIIGLGNDYKNQDPSGIYGKFAYKIMLYPDAYRNPEISSVVLRGVYFAPEIDLRTMKYDNENNGGRNREEQSTIAFMIRFGKQWVFYESFVVDIYGGIGYGFNSSDEERLPYGFSVASGDIPFAYTWGFRLGYAFGR